MGFPRFSEYEGGTILEVNFRVNEIDKHINDGEPFLIIIINEHKMLNYLSGEKVIALHIKCGSPIIEDYCWEITHQIVKKGGLKDEYKT